MKYNFEMFPEAPTNGQTCTQLDIFSLTFHLSIYVNAIKFSISVLFLIAILMQKSRFSMPIYGKIKEIFEMVPPKNETMKLVHFSLISCTQVNDIIMWI